MPYKRERKPYKPEEAFDGKEPEPAEESQYDGRDDTTESWRQRTETRKPDCREGHKGRSASRGRGKSDSEKGKFVRVTRLFPSKGGNSYTVFLNETVVNTLLNFLEESKDSDLLGITLKADGSCSLWGMRGDK